jgi:hypothetical protein
VRSELQSGIPTAVLPAEGEAKRLCECCSSQNISLTFPGDSFPLYMQRSDKLDIVLGPWRSADRRSPGFPTATIYAQVFDWYPLRSVSRNIVSQAACFVLPFESHVSSSRSLECCRASGKRAFATPESLIKPRPERQGHQKSSARIGLDPFDLDQLFHRALGSMEVAP